MKLSQPRIDALIKHLASDSGNLFDAMIVRGFVGEMLSSEFQVGPRLKDIFAGGSEAILDQAVQDAKASNDLSVEAIKASLDKRIGEVGQRYRTLYTVVIPLSINLFRMHLFSKMDLTIVLQREKIEFGDLFGLAPEGLAALESKSAHQPNSLGTIAAIALDVRARDPEFAMDKALSTATVFAGMMSFCLSGQTLMQFPPMPIGSIQLQKCVILMENGKLVKTYGDLEHVEEGPFPLALRFEDLWRNVKELEHRLDECERKAPKSVMSSIFKALELYGEAASDLDPNFSFLKFWIGLENMMKLGEDLPARAVARRLKTAFRSEPEIWRIGISRLLYKRNRLVHRGLMDVTPQEVYFSKLLYVFTLRLFLEYGREYSRVEPIATLIDMRSIDDEALQEVKLAIDSMLQK